MMAHCETCGLEAESATHPCAFEHGCSCWRGVACKVPPLPAFDAHDERIAEQAQSIIKATQARLDNAL